MRALRYEPEAAIRPHRKHWRPSRSAGATDTELCVAAPEKAAEKLDRGCRVYCAHGVQLLRGRVCLCQRDCGRGSYAYFPNDDLRLAHEQSNMRLISYEIESSTKINDKLYEYNVLIKTDFAPEEYTRVYYFVGNIDGELKFIVNASFVPDELSDGLDVGAYSYGEEDSSSVIFEN